jgi:hypothetical protein
MVSSMMTTQSDAMAEMLKDVPMRPLGPAPNQPETLVPSRAAAARIFA